MLKKILSAFIFIVAIIFVSSSISIFIAALFADAALDNLDEIELIAEKAMPNFLGNEKFNDLLKNINKENIKMLCESSEAPEDLCDNLNLFSEDELRIKYITYFVKPQIKIKEAIENYINYGFIASIVVYLLGIFLVFLSTGFKFFNSLFKMGVISSLSILPYLLFFGYGIKYVTSYELVSLLQKFFPKIPAAFLELTGTIAIEFTKILAGKLISVMVFAALIFIALMVVAYFFRNRCSNKRSSSE